MAARLGMTDLIRRLRQFCEAGPEDYTLNGETFWTDIHLQEILDGHKKRCVNVPLRMVADQLPASLIEYKRYELPLGYTAVEGPAGGSEVFKITDSTGLVTVADDYTFTPRDLAITFDADQLGYVRYWSGFSYNLQQAAGEVWSIKAGHMHQAINFSADGARFDREKIFEHCMTMAARFGYRQGMKVSRMVRTDVAGSRELEGF